LQGQASDFDAWDLWHRDRFGLAHFDPEPGETMPVALMSYPVRDVLQAARKQTPAISGPALHRLAEEIGAGAAR